VTDRGDGGARGGTPVHFSRVLQNGLRVLVVPQPHLSRAHVGFYARTGSRFETEATNGISHFTEHMLYRGTPSLPTAHAVNDAFESLGGYLYAATQVDFGVFSVTMPHESLAEATRLFADVLINPTFRDIEIEQGIVCEEILEDLDDEGRQIDADNLSRSLIYGKHPLGFTITGDEERVRSFDERALHAHHERHYGASTSVLVFSGNVTEAALDLAEAQFATMRPGTPITATAPVHTQKKPRTRMVESVASQTELRVSLRALPEGGAQGPVIDMLMRILDDGMSTRLYHRISDAKGLCYDVSAAYDGYEDDGVLDFAAGCVHERTAQVTKEILGLLVDLANTGPTAEELDKAKRRARWDVRAMVDAPEDLASHYAVSTLFNRFEPPHERLLRLEKVTRDDVLQVLHTVAAAERVNVVAVGMLEGGQDQRLLEVVRGHKLP
jgi:predicted Zn-dependent peptidase